MSKFVTVWNRESQRAEMLTGNQVRKIRKNERTARIGSKGSTHPGVMPDHRFCLPYNAASINRIFFYLPPVKDEQLQKCFVGHYSASAANEDGVPNPNFDGGIVITGNNTEGIPASQIEQPAPIEVAEPTKEKAAKAKKPASKPAAAKKQTARKTIKKVVKEA